MAKKVEAEAAPTAAIWPLSDLNWTSDSPNGHAHHGRSHDTRLRIATSLSCKEQSHSRISVAGSLLLPARSNILRSSFPYARSKASIAR